MRESLIEAYLVRRVKELGGEVRKVKWIGRRGAPDRVVMLPAFRLSLPESGSPEVDRWLEQTTAAIVEQMGFEGQGRAIWVELKATGKEPEPHQLREHKRMRAMGQRVEVVDSFERVDEVLA